jgi:cytochrome b subunit of formate dehydrogenase
LRGPASVLLAAGALLAAALPARAQEAKECLECHGGKDLVATRGGKEVSLRVDGAALAASVHRDLSCVACHADLEGTEAYPHRPAPLAKVECGTCHDGEQELHAASLHGKKLAEGDPLAPRCQDCHGSHDILPVKDRLSAVFPTRVPFVCGKCHQEGAPVQKERAIHQDRILENYSESMHAEGLLRKGLAVAATCASCHTAHQILPHTDPRSSIARANIAATCTVRCHTGIEQVHRKVIKGELWEKEANVLPACVDCHQPHRARKVFYDQGMADADCLACHARPDVRRARDGKALRVDAAEVAGSRHARVSCSQCHAGVSRSLDRPCETVAKAVDCSSCHAEVAEQYRASIHGRLSAEGSPNAPTCGECHGSHGVQGKRAPGSPTFPTNVPLLCARCHREGERAAVRYAGTEHSIIERYTESIHGKGLLKSGLTVTAMCTDCHTAHGELPRSDPASTVNPANLPATCGRCHYGIEERFESSVHSASVTKTDKALPVCSTCHTAHTIRRADSEGFKLDIMGRCGDCHAAIAETYFDTYHGKVSRLGYTKTAKCYDCHGAHDILPPSDPRSHLSRQNVVATCQKCHEGATRRFAGYLTHATHHDPAKYPLLFWTFWGMTTLLAGTFLVGGLHTAAWLWRAVRERRAGHVALRWGGPESRAEEASEPMVPGMEGRHYVRFSRTNRLLHVVMIVSFISLALTGLTLKFSYTSWAVTLSRILGGFEAAGNIHRFAAVGMVSVFCVHLADLFRRRRTEFGTWKALLLGPHSMIPGRKDWTEFVGSLKWFLGRGPRPRYGRWTYWEKFDYFAVFWGIAIIGSTGLTLWFPEFFTRFLPGWSLNVATIVHSDEALLAVGFIFTVHFFNTHLRPEKFPMDIVVFTGQMTVEDLRRDKPAEYDEVVRAGALEGRLGEPYQPVVTRTIRAFGWVALSLGFFIVLWILYAMLFAYR